MKTLILTALALVVALAAPALAGEITNPPPGAFNVVKGR